MDEAPPWDLEEAQRPQPLGAPADGPGASLGVEPAPAARGGDPSAATGRAAEPRAAAALASPGPAPSRLAACRVERTALGDRWAALVGALVAAGDVQALVRELAMQAELCAELPLSDGGGTVWRLTVERETLRSPALCDKLLAALQGAAGVAGLRLEVVAGVAQDSPARRDAEQAALRQAEAERVIHDDPLVQTLLAQFSTARIVAGSIKPV